MGTDVLFLTLSVWTQNHYLSSRDMLST